jgi:hypothetical protein
MIIYLEDVFVVVIVNVFDFSELEKYCLVIYYRLFLHYKVH